MHYDITLKTLFHQLPVRLLELLIGQRGVEILTVEFPSVQRRLPDLVLRLDDGRNYHLELQSDADPSMPWRMLEYYGLIRQHDERPLVQQVLYVGRAENTLAAGLSLDSLAFRYQVVDIREIDGEVLLQSPALEDNILALLCRLEDEAEAVRRLFRRIAALNANARADALEQVVILTGLRDLKPLIQREIREMPITVDIMKNDFLREAFEKGQQAGLLKGRQEGRREGEQKGEHRLLAKQLEQRFGFLPEDVVERLQTASREELERWGVALLSARTLADVFR